MASLCAWRKHNALLLYSFLLLQITMYYIYILRCTDNSLYTGITTDFKKRIRTHMAKEKTAAKYTKSREVLGAVALWSCPDRSSALKLEYCIKALRKAKKEELIKNPEFVNNMGLETNYNIIEASCNTYLFE